MKANDKINESCVKVYEYVIGYATNRGWPER